MSQTNGMSGAGEAAPEAGIPGVAELPVAIRNYRTEKGWQVAHITPEENVSIQAAVRARNCQIVEQGLEDARRLLTDCAVAGAVTTRNVIEVALYLSDRRTVHASRVYDEFLARKIATERGEMPVAEEQEVCYD
jgi:hypothetical protein